MTIGMTTTTGARPHRVSLQNPGPPIPDGEGGFTQSWVDAAPPALSVSIEAATRASLERVAAGAVAASATHIVHGPFHPQATIKSRLVFNGRQFSVLNTINVEERSAEMILLCAEVLP